MSKFFSKEAFAVMYIRNFRLFLAYRFFATSATLMQAVFLFAYEFKKLNISKTYPQLLYFSYL
jgi:hypothetical protein